MIFSLIVAILWSVTILFSLLGWGWFVVSPSSKKDYSLGEMGVFGMAFSMIFGGVLNVLKLISPFSIKLFVFAGALLFFIYCSKQHRQIITGIRSGILIVRSNKFILFFSIAIAVFISIRLLMSLSFYGFHGFDDEAGYLAFPHKMIETGELGPDPFSERRLVSSLGGMYFLHTFILAAVDYKYIHSIDNCVAYIIFLMLLFKIVSVATLPRSLSIIIAVLAAVIASPTSNITAVFVSAALFLYILKLTFSHHKDAYENFIIAPLVIAALIITKSNMIAPTAILAAYLYITQAVTFFKNDQGYKRVVGILLMPTILICTYVLPWMVSMYKSSGTLLYPILGNGYHGISYGTFLSHYFSFDVYSFARLFFELYGALGLLVPALMVGGMFILFKVKDKNRFLAALCVALTGVLVLIYTTGGYSLYYYSFAFLMPTVIFCLIAICSQKDKNELLIQSFSFAIIAFMLGIYFQKGFDILQEIKRGVSFEDGVSVGYLNKPLMTIEERNSYKNLQDAIPEHETLLARLDKNFLLDFKRNKVYVVDSPGASSFPPGMPMFKGENALSDYLLSKNIKYIACSCGKNAPFSKDVLSGMLKVHVNPWLKTETMNYIDFQENFQKLMLEKKTLYDDGVNVVLDISKKK